MLATSLHELATSTHVHNTLQRGRSSPHAPVAVLVFAPLKKRRFPRWVPCTPCTPPAARPCAPRCPPSDAPRPSAGGLGTLPALLGPLPTPHAGASATPRAGTSRTFAERASSPRGGSAAHAPSSGSCRSARKSAMATPSSRAGAPVRAPRAVVGAGQEARARGVRASAQAPPRSPGGRKCGATRRELFPAGRKVLTEGFKEAAAGGPQ